MSDTPNLPARQPAGIAFVYNDYEITFDENRFIDMTQMWRAAGSPVNKAPKDWLVTEQGSGFVQDLMTNLNVAKNHIWKSRRGKHLGGTWAHWQVALAYAKYLSHEFHRYANEAFREWAEEKANPDLKAQRAVEGYRRRGWDDSRIMNRLEGIVQRNRLTDPLKDHEVQGRVMPSAPMRSTRKCLEAAREIKVSRGLPPSAKARDHLDTLELAAIRFAEAMAEIGVKDECAHGNSQCCTICRQAVAATSQAMASMGLVAKRV